MRVWIKQERGKKNCGIIAVAVLTGVSIEIAANAIGKNGATTTKQLSCGLHKLGYECPNRLQVGKRPPLGIAKLVDPSRRSGWHWVVVDGEKIYDGINGLPDGTVRWKKGWKLTSYLPVTKT